MTPNESALETRIEKEHSQDRSFVKDLIRPPEDTNFKLENTTNPKLYGVPFGYRRLDLEVESSLLPKVFIETDPIMTMNMMIDNARKKPMWTVPSVDLYASMLIALFGNSEGKQKEEIEEMRKKLAEDWKTNHPIRTGTLIYCTDENNTSPTPTKVMRYEHSDRFGKSQKFSTTKSQNFPLNTITNDEFVLRQLFAHSDPSAARDAFYWLTGKPLQIVTHPDERKGYSRHIYFKETDTHATITTNGIGDSYARLVRCTGKKIDWHKALHR